MKYEIMTILDPTLTEKELEKTQSEIKDSLAEHGFEIVSEDIWGVRDLAYKIKSFTKGFYTVQLFTGEPAGMPGLKSDLRIQNGLVRHLIIKVDDEHILQRYEDDTLAAVTSGRKQKLSKHAEELSKKVTSKKKAEPKKEVAEEDSKELDEKLQAIIDDKDIDV